METGLAQYVLSKRITAVDLRGLATDYCVNVSAFDAVEMLPKVKIRFIEDASRWINSERTEKAIKEMRDCDVEIVHSNHIYA